MVLTYIVQSITVYTSILSQFLHNGKAVKKHFRQIVAVVIVNSKSKTRSTFNNILSIHIYNRVPIRNHINQIRDNAKYNPKLMVGGDAVERKCYTVRAIQQVIH